MHHKCDMEQIECLDEQNGRVCRDALRRFPFSYRLLPMPLARASDPTLQLLNHTCISVSYRHSTPGCRIFTLTGTNTLNVDRTCEMRAIAL